MERFDEDASKRLSDVDLQFNNAPYVKFYAHFYYDLCLVICIILFYDVLTTKFSGLNFTLIE